MTSEPLALLCAGAAKGLVAAVAPAFTAESGVAIDGTYGAVGALVEKLRGGARCDAIVLTAALVARLEKEGFVVPGTTAPLGSVATAIAVAHGSARPAIADASALHATLVGATRLYFPDPERATAGIHFADVLRRLGIADVVAKLIVALRQFSQFGKCLFRRRPQLAEQAHGSQAGGRILQQFDELGNRRLGLGAHSTQGEERTLANHTVLILQPVDQRWNGECGGRAVPNILEWVRYRTGRAVGDLQQCGVCWEARHGDAVL